MQPPTIFRNNPQRVRGVFTKDFKIVWIPVDDDKPIFKNTFSLHEDKK